MTPTKQPIIKLLQNPALSADEKNQSMGLMRGAFKSTNLDGASFKGANMARALLEFASLKGANLTDANLRGSELAAADFTDADVTGTNFTMRGFSIYGFGANWDSAAANIRTQSAASGALIVQLTAAR